MLDPALLDKEEEDPKDLSELRVDLNSFEAVPVEFDPMLPMEDAALGRGGILPITDKGEHRVSFVLSRRRRD